MDYDKLISRADQLRALAADSTDKQTALIFSCLSEIYMLFALQQHRVVSKREKDPT